MKVKKLAQGRFLMINWLITIYFSIACFGAFIAGDMIGVIHCILFGVLLAQTNECYQWDKEHDLTFKFQAY
jgi:hypothetical protein